MKEYDDMIRSELCEELVKGFGFEISDLWNFREDTLRMMVRDLYDMNEREHNG